MINILRVFKIDKITINTEVNYFNYVHISNTGLTFLLRTRTVMFVDTSIK